MVNFNITTQHKKAKFDKVPTSFLPMCLPSYFAFYNMRFWYV